MAGDQETGAREIQSRLCRLNEMARPMLRPAIKAGKGRPAFDEFPPTVAWPQQERWNLVTIIIFDHARSTAGGANDRRPRKLGSRLWWRLTWPPVSIHARSRPVLVLERLLSGSRISLRNERSAALCSLVNPAGRSTTRWQLSADHHL